MRFGGVSGAIASLLGLVAVPTVVLIVLGTIYDRYQDIPAFQHGFAGLSAAAAGLLVAMAIKLAKPYRTLWVEAGIALVTFAAVGLVHAPLLWALVVAVPVSVWLMIRKTS